MNVQEYLKKHEVPFKVYTHPDAFSAQRMAQVMHIPGQDVAKTVLLRLDHGHSFAVAVLPATHRVDLDEVSTVLGGAFVELASEDLVAQYCPDCERGVLPPFGSQYGLKTLVDKALALDEEIVFEGNTHHESVRMKFKDYYDLEHPLVMSFAHHQEPSVKA